MIGAPATRQDDYDRVYAMIMVVDERARAMDEKWGVGRLPRLVPVEWADKFTAQHQKFSKACLAWNVEDARRHGEAMVRAYAKLDELAVATGADQRPPEQWEFHTPETGLIILVRDRDRIQHAQTFDRPCQVWALDEIGDLIRKYPTIVAIKDAFPGAVCVEQRPTLTTLESLNQEIPL